MLTDYSKICQVLYYNFIIIIWYNIALFIIIYPVYKEDLSQKLGQIKILCALLYNWWWYKKGKYILKDELQ